MTIQDYNATPRKYHSPINYADNGNLFGDSVAMAAITYPATNVQVLETRDFWPDLGTWTIPWNYAPGPGGSLPWWHTGGGNWGFGDGREIHETGRHDKPDLYVESRQRCQRVVRLGRRPLRPGRQGNGSAVCRVSPERDSPGLSMRRVG